jgi:hypothetical protein
VETLDEALEAKEIKEAVEAFEALEARDETTGWSWITPPNLLVGIGHRRGVGKDTFGALLDEALFRGGYQVHRLAFARSMKNFAHKIFKHHGLKDFFHYATHPRSETDRELPWLNKRTPRDIWIAFANAMRGIERDIWVRHLDNEINNIICMTQRNVLQPRALIITDVRFSNEAESIKDWRGFLVNIVRPEAEVFDDPAEHNLDYYKGWDMEVLNNGTIDDLKVQVNILANYLMSSREEDRKDGPQ